jgi:translocation and assembly module TamA
MQRALLLVLLLFFSSPLFAGINVSVEINGVDKELEENVRLYLSIEQQKEHDSMSESRLRQLHKKSNEEIIKALQPFGYYHPVIKGKITRYVSEDTITRWRVSYDIDPGPPLLIELFDFKISEEMRKDKYFQDLVTEPPLKAGMIFSHVDYEDFKSSLAKIASERGYFNARFVEHRVEIDLEKNKVRIFLHYEGETRYVFGDVEMDQDLLDPELLQRYVPFERGSPYTIADVIELQQALNDSYFFQTVEVAPGNPLPDTNVIPINVTLTPRKPHRFGIGLGFGTDTGARAKFSWEMPRINKSGHHFETITNISEIGYSFVNNYYVPIFNPRTDQLIFSAGILNETVDTRESTLKSIGVTLKHTRDKWRESVTLNYQQEDYDVADDSGVSKLLIPGINWSRTWGDDFIYAIDGLRLDMDFRGASEQLISDTDFVQFQGHIKFISSLNNNNRFITRGALGSTWTDDFHMLPTSIRFFAGGSQTVRGYSYQSLGPEDDSGEVVGAKYLMIGSVEFEHGFTEKWAMAIFYDAGNAIDDFNDDLAKGAGFGFRWRSPVGMIRLDFASALSLDDNPWRIHVTIGPDL